MLVWWGLDFVLFVGMFVFSIVCFFWWLIMIFGLGNFIGVIMMLSLFGYFFVMFVVVYIVMGIIVIVMGMSIFLDFFVSFGGMVVFCFCLSGVCFSYVVDIIVNDLSKLVLEDKYGCSWFVDDLSVLVFFCWCYVLIGVIMMVFLMLGMGFYLSYYVVDM